MAGIRCLALILGSPEAVASLKPLLGDEALEARVAAAEELGRLGDPSGLSVLMSILNDGGLETHIRCRAAMALGKIQDARAQDALFQAWKSDPGQENVGRCLRAVPGPP